MKPIEFKTILVPIDFSEHATRALDAAVAVAKQSGGRVHLLHAYQINVGGISPYGLVIPEGWDRDVREAATRQLEIWRDKVAAEGVPVEFTLTPMFPSEAISEVAREIGADLIVMGTRGLTGIQHVMLGSVAERTVRIAPCPVLTVKSEAS